VLAVSLVCIPTFAEDIGKDVCLSCHGLEGFADDAGHPLVVDGETFGKSLHGPLECVTCHSDATSAPHEQRPKRPGPDTCATCHQDIVEKYQHSIHGRARANGTTDAATCTDCHGDVHAVTSHTQPTSSAHWSKLAATCARCHAGPIAAKYAIPVARPAEAYLQSAHARAVRAGRHGAVCSDCHGDHDILPSSDPQATIWRTNVPTTCGRCHAEALAAYTASVHGEAVARGVRGAPVCTDCHGEHRILSPSEPTSPVFAANLPQETCGRCHADARLSEKYGLEVHQVAAFQDSFHGLALRAGKLRVANCSSCHGVHDIRPSSDPRSHVNPANLAATCGKCHPGAGTRFAIGSVHGVADATGPWLAAWVRFIYLWLIGLTIGGMVVHNLLDLSRKARRPRGAPPVAPPGLPPRMTHALRWQHGLTMLSFSVLVYTGFALKFPESWWAAPLLRWETQLGLRGLIHRIAAVIMTVALVWHLGQIAFIRRLRTCFLGMLPSIYDARVLFGTLAYYLRLRSHPPHSGKTFNYAEKAEYLAFMWGSVVMTVTGLLLWFADLTLHYLPGWVPDVATAVHFYEAILATLAILVWHFYWVIFDPEVYPMDWTWWDGNPPPARVMERLPEEHQDAAP
jgi:cytochrome b subunit of formate dehydrogenase